jgi:hypothetical protein
MFHLEIEAQFSFQNAVFEIKDRMMNVRFEVFTAVTMKNGVFWVVTPCGSCKTYTSHTA